MKIVEYSIEDITKDEQLAKALVDLFNLKGMNNKVRAVVESGTYLGTGTTKLVIDAILGANYKKLPTFYTIEASEQNFIKAKENLKEYPWVKIIHGISVDINEATDFLAHDDHLINHELYPDVFIDDLKDPVGFYSKEVDGQLFGQGERGENDVFSRVIPEVWQMNPLIVLDSCGGIGWLEFKTIVEMMKDKKFYLFLDDIQHLKHCRSAAYIKEKRGWKIISETDRWMLATNKP